MFLQRPKLVLWAFILFSVLGSILAGFRVRFSFDLEDFFPEGDADLAYFNEFREKFEPDDNFLLLALHREGGVGDSAFLADVLEVSQKLRDTPSIIAAQSLLQVAYPIKTPFAFTSIPALHLEEPQRYQADIARALTDERLAGTLISRDAQTLVVAMKTKDDIQQTEAEQLIKSIEQLLANYPRLKDYHLLGRANFQREMVAFQIKEFTFAVIVSGLLVVLVMYLIFRRFWGVVVASGSILFGMLVFVALLGVFGARLDTMALLYPIVMIIVATSDVIHIMSKYIDELSKGKEKLAAIRATIQEIGQSILLTSATTAIGFVSLLTSKIAPVRNFGLFAGIGVMLAYLTVMTFTAAILTLFDKDQIVKSKEEDGSLRRSFWSDVMLWIYNFSKDKPRQVLALTGLFISICVWGTSKISTNNQISGLLPKGYKVSQDFKFFEQHFGGFRPLEIAITLAPAHDTDDFAVLQQIDSLERHLASYQGKIEQINSVSMIYKSLHRAFHGDQQAFYQIPQDEETFLKYQKLAKRLDGAQGLNILVSKDKRHARISARLKDLGADSVKALTRNIDAWMASHLDTTVLKARQTGTGVMVDKNAEYIRDSLLWGLLLAVLVVCAIWVWLYKSWKMVLIASIPNLLPLLFAAAVLGFAGIPLEGGVAIVFSIIFGIAVDDTIHFLGRFKLLQAQQLSTEESIKITLVETGKAMVLTSITLFAGFIVLLFSANPAANTVGLLISTTLLTALVFDLFLLPVLLRYMHNK